MNYYKIIYINYLIMDFLDIFDNEVFCALIGILCIIGIFLCMWICLYKYANYKERKFTNVIQVNQNI